MQKSESVWVQSDVVPSFLVLLTHRHSFDCRGLLPLPFNRCQVVLQLLLTHFLPRRLPCAFLFPLFLQVRRVPRFDLPLPPDLALLFLNEVINVHLDSPLLLVPLQTLSKIHLLKFNSLCIQQTFLFPWLFQFLQLNLFFVLRYRELVLF